MTKSEIEGLFPLEVKLTEALIKKGRLNLTVPSHCIGALTLKRGLRKAGASRKILDVRTRWMFWTGRICLTGSIISNAMELNDGSLIDAVTKHRDDIHVISYGEDGEIFDFLGDKDNVKPQVITFKLRK